MNHVEFWTDTIPKMVGPIGLFVFVFSRFVILDRTRSEQVKSLREEIDDLKSSRDEARDEILSLKSKVHDCERDRAAIRRLALAAGLQLDIPD